MKWQCGIWKLTALLCLGPSSSIDLSMIVQPSGTAALAQTEGTVESAEVDRLQLRMIQLFHQGKYAEAIPLAEQVIAILRRVQGSNSPELATALNNLAGLYDSQGRY